MHINLNPTALKYRTRGFYVVDKMLLWISRWAQDVLEMSEVHTLDRDSVWVSGEAFYHYPIVSDGGYLLAGGGVNCPAPPLSVLHNCLLSCQTCSLDGANGMGHFN